MPEIKVSICKNGASLGEWKITDPDAVPPAERRSAEDLVTALMNVSEFANSFPVPMGSSIKIKVGD